MFHIFSAMSVFHIRDHNNKSEENVKITFIFSVLHGISSKIISSTLKQQCILRTNSCVSNHNK
uniref:Uncharacterized protein n=1 Tax=Arundo donax TaxID=35708 RepID=A0A0A8Y336_ARUDO